MPETPNAGNGKRQVTLAGGRKVTGTIDAEGFFIVDPNTDPAPLGLNESAKNTIRNAEEIARMMGEVEIAPAHLLAAMAGEHGILRYAAGSAGADVEEIKNAALSTRMGQFGFGPQANPRAKRAMEAARKHANEHCEGRMNGTSLFYGVLEAEVGCVESLLRRFGTSIAAVKAELFG